MAGLIPPDELMASPAWLSAVTARTPQATMSVEVLPPDGKGDALARFGGPLKTGDHAPTRGGFASVGVSCKGTSGEPTWSLDLTTRDPSLMPGGIDPDAHLLDPLEHNIFQGWWWLLVEDEWQRIPVGAGTVDSIALNDGEDGFVMTVLVRDLLADVARAKWDESIPLGGEPVSEAVRKILASRFPRRPMSVPPTIERLPEDWSHGEPNADPTVDLARLAEAVGAVARTSRTGEFILDPVQDRETAPIRARFVEGPREDDEGNGDGTTTFTAISTALIDMDEVVNACTITSASTAVDPPVSGHWEITDSTDPLWVGHGRYSRSLSNALMTTAEQCEVMAKNLVQQHSVVRSLVVESTPCPYLKPGDVVEVTRLRAGVAGRWTVREWSLDGAIGMQRTVVETERRWAT